MKEIARFAIASTHGNGADITPSSDRRIALRRSAGDRHAAGQPLAQLGPKVAAIANLYVQLMPGLISFELLGQLTRFATESAFSSPRSARFSWPRGHASSMRPRKRVVRCDIK